jgi:hypothetical protein
MTGTKTPFYVQLGHAHPWLLLFAPRSGLFYWTPVAWLAVAGIAPSLRDPRWRVFSLSGLLASMAIVYLSAAVLDWDGSSSFGARRLVGLVPLLTLWASVAAMRAQRWLSAGHRMRVALGFAICAPFVWTFGGAVAGLPSGKTTIERVLSQEELYGAGSAVAWSLVDRFVGDVAVYPAALVFAFRYGLPVTSFLDASTFIGYERDVRSLGTPTPLPPLNDPRLVRTTRGGVHENDALRVDGRASVVFAVRWPVATHLVVEAAATQPTEVRVGRGRALREPQWFGSIRVEGAMKPYRVPVPAGGFDSGMNEIVLEVAAPRGAPVRVRSLQPEDANTYPPQP